MRIDGAIGNRLTRSAVLAGAGLLCQQEALAMGFRLPNQDPHAIARGNAFAATADNPSAIYYNPAGITQLQGQRLQAGVYAVRLGVEHESGAGVVTKNEPELQAVPHLYYVCTSADSKAALGLGIYAPYGLGLKYPSDSTFRTLAKEANLLYASANPVFALKVHPTLSLGAGPTLNFSQVKLKQGITTAFDDQFEFDGDAFGMGFNAGIHWQPHEKWAVGVNYRYRTELKYGGNARVSGNPFLPSASTPSSTEIRFPQYVVAGISYRPTANWNLEVNIDWTDWDNVNEIEFKGTPLGDLALPLHYRSSFMYAFGVTRYLPNGLDLSLGYCFSENSVPDRTFNPIVPDDDLHLGFFGVGYRSKRWNLALAYHFGYNGEREVRGSRPAFPTTETADGLYRILHHAVNFSATFNY